VLPYTMVDDDFALLDAQRWQVAGRDDLDDLAGFLRTVVLGQTSGNRLLDLDDVHPLVDVLGGRGPPQRDLIGAAAEREDEMERLSAEQAVIIRAARQLNRVEVRGGAGNGKTWLAVEQARRLTREGQRVALTCYSRGLAAWRERRSPRGRARSGRRTSGTFTTRASSGEPTGSDDDSHFWECSCPSYPGFVEEVGGDAVLRQLRS